MATVTTNSLSMSEDDFQTAVNMMDEMFAEQDNTKLNELWMTLNWHLGSFFEKNKETQEIKKEDESLMEEITATKKAMQMIIDTIQVTIGHETFPLQASLATHAIQLTCLENGVAQNKKKRDNINYQMLQKFTQRLPQKYEALSKALFSRWCLIG